MRKGAPGPEAERARGGQSGQAVLVVRVIAQAEDHLADENGYRAATLARNASR